ncbi:glycosyltransferase family 2 protein [Microbacterium sp. MC2]
MTVALLVVSYGSHALVEEGLSRTMLPEGAFVVVVDNPTTAGERARMRELAAEHGWSLVEPERNLGFGGGMNVAAARAIELGATSLVLLNPDAHVEEDGVAMLAAHTTRSPDSLVSPLVLRPDGSHFASLMELDLDTGSMRRVREGVRYERSALWVSGACVAASASLWERVGGFDDDYFLYWEDVDLSVRVAEAGGTVEVADDIRAIHSPGGTQRAGTESGKSALYYYYNVRNRLVFAEKHRRLIDRRRWRRRALPAAYEILLRGGRRQFLRPSGSIWPALRGTRAGLRFRADSDGAGV